MSDVRITCPKCAKENTVSEYADLITCRFCGGDLPKSQAGQNAGGGAGETRGRHEAASQEEEAPPPRILAPGESPASLFPPSDSKGDENQARHMQTRIVTTKKRGWLTMLLPWLVFAVVGVTMFVLRYGGRAWGVPIPEQLPEWLKTYGPYIAIGLHFVIVLAAFKDQIFSGILCLLIPPYPYYYLFLICDFFYLRAVLAGIYVGIGWDSLWFINEKTGFIIKAINDWIASGGGPV